MPLRRIFTKQIVLQAFKYQASPMLGIIHIKEKK